MKKGLPIIFLFLFSNLFAQSTAWERCDQLGKGMNLSWLETWWNGTADKDYSNYLNMERLSERAEDIRLMHDLGVSTIRLPICFEVWEYNTPPYTIDHPEYFEAIDSMIAWAKLYDQKVIIDYQHGSLNDCNFEQNAIRLKALWQQIATTFQNTDPDQVFFELFNEPHDISAENWQQVAEELIAVIRPIVPQHTIIVGGIDYNGIHGLRSLKPFDDDNIIYTFHFYEPFLFTHQGAEWVGAPVTTVDIPFPFDSELMPDMNPAANNTFGEFLYESYYIEGQSEYLRFYLEAVKAWSLENNLPVFCGEWGTHYMADEESRCRHAQAVVQYLQELAIPYCYWEWDRNFSFFDDQEPSMTNLPSCIEEAWNSEIPQAPNNLSSSINLLIPNPIADELAIYFPDPDLYDRLEVFTMEGRIIGRYFLGGSSLIKEVADWPIGIYLLRFENWKTGEVVTRKILKQ